MPNRIIFLISFCFIFSAFIILFLYIRSYNSNDIRNGFIRKIKSVVLESDNSVDMRHNSYYLAGTSDSHIYLGNSMLTAHMLVVSTNFTDTLHVRLDRPSHLQYWDAVQVVVDHPQVYVMDGISPAILRGILPKPYMERFMLNNTFFTNPTVSLSPSSFVFRTIDKTLGQYILTKKKLGPDSSYIHYASDILEKQVDGVFCTDGMLHHNREMNILVYIYYYRNQFICMDTNLNLLYKGNTIDTISQAKIKVAEIQSNNSITLASPPFLVNKKSCVYGNWLFINSNLIADNEDKRTFQKSNVIDVYNLKARGTYEFSFYISHYQGHKMKGFQVLKDRLFAIHDRYLLSYQLDSIFSREFNSPLEEESKYDDLENNQLIDNQE